MAFLNTRRFLVVPTAMLFCVLPVTGIAGLVTSNFDGSPKPGNGAQILPTNFFANSFATDGQNYLLDSVTLEIAQGNSTGGFFVQIFDNTGANQPGSIVPNGSLSGPANPPGTNASHVRVDYSVTAPIVLSANTSYWVVAGVTSGGGTYEWALSAIGEAEDAGSLWNIGKRRPGNGTGTWFAESSPLILGVNATAVPEPSSLGLMAVGTVPFILRRRRRLRGHEQ